MESHFNIVVGHYGGVFTVSAFLAASGPPFNVWLGLGPKVHSVASGLQGRLHMAIHHTITKQSAELHTVHVHYVVRKAQSVRNLYISIKELRNGVRAHVCTK